jgi:DNA topoisomerase-2
MSTQKKKPNYENLDPIQHVLLRPEVWLDSLVPEKTNEYICSDKQIIQKNIIISPALIRIFIEPLSNAIDNVYRSLTSGFNTPCTTIKVNIDEKTGETTIFNDGDVIPVEIHEKYNCYNHTLVFSKMMTSSNYDDSVSRENISGLNGVGIKGTAIFSKFFQVRGFDPNNKKLFVQKWYDNLSKTSEPVVTDTTKYKNGFTEISYIPDFERFSIKNYTEDIINLYKRFVIDCGMLTGCKVYFNNELIKIRSLLEYSKLYKEENDDTEDKEEDKEDKDDEEDEEDKKENKEEYININYKGSQVVLLPSKGTGVCISFANRIFTSLGGVHVKAWYDALLTPILQKINKPKSPQLTLDNIKPFFKLFVVSTVTNPRYDNQCKRMLKSPNVEAECKAKDTKEILKWKVMEKIQELIDMKNMAVLKKTESKKGGVLNIKGLHLCSNAKGKNAYKCMLAICEGESAKTFLTQGLKNGVGSLTSDYISIFPIRGKILNTRNEKPTKIASNEVITNLIKIIGLKYDVDYNLDKNYETLRHGKVLIVVDQDTDGTHIMGLFTNFIEHLFPSLLKRKEPFLVSLQTPLVRVYVSKNKELLFYDTREFQKYMDSNKTIKFTKKPKYYKGLGTSNNKEIEEVCGKKLLELKTDNDTTNILNKVFHNKNADSRKSWMQEYLDLLNKDSSVKWKNDSSHETESITISEFLNKHMINFSIEDCKRSIPSIDGLKESQRKVLYACFKRKLNYTGDSLKVAQLAGYVAEHSDYHHGEESLNGTIINLAQFFVGTNNIPLLLNDGQFGTRLTSSDHASPRYIFTKLNELTRLLFIDEDDDLLEYNYDGEQKIEPKFYMPIIPIVLVNGAKGIGTGWSCEIPQYNPFEVITETKNWIKGQPVSDTLIPWYYGFKGKIEELSKNKYVTKGILNKLSETKYQITELPVGVWTNNYKEMLNTMLENKEIKDFNSELNTEHVNITILENKEGIICSENSLKLTSKLSATNMVLFDEKGVIKKFNSPKDIIEHFCSVRLPYYEKRLTTNISKLEEDLLFYSNKKRFIESVMAGNLSIYTEGKSREEKDIITNLEEMKFHKINDNYNYLLTLPIKTFTKENIDKLTKDVKDRENRLKAMKKQTGKDLWLIDLDNLEEQLTKFYKQKDNERVNTPSTKKK